MAYQDYDWNNYWLLYERKEGYLLERRGNVQDLHTGDIFFVYKNEIKSIEYVVLP